MMDLYTNHPMVNIGILLLVTSVLILQTQLIIHCLFGIKYKDETMKLTLLECTVFCYIWIHLVQVAQIIHYAKDGYYIQHPYRFLYTILYLVILLFMYYKSSKLRLSDYLVLFSSTIFLPFKQWPTTMYVLALIAYCIRSILLLKEHHIKKNTNLSAYSIKESLDRMDFGLLFYRASGFYKGRIVLENSVMHELMHSMVDRPIYNGFTFMQYLSDGQVIDGIHRIHVQNELLYRLQDGRIYSFHVEEIKVKNKLFHLLIASNASKQWKATYNLYKQNEELQRRNKELHTMLLNMESICEAEELLHIKEQIHSVLGHKITILLRSIQNHEDIDDETLLQFSNSLSKDIENSHEQHEYSIQRLKEEFIHLGITIKTHGRLPKDPVLKKVLYDIGMEGMINAIRHGYATKIDLTIKENEHEILFTIENNGTCKKIIHEGTGIQGMKRNLAKVNGSLQITTCPNFLLYITIPKEV